MNLTVTQNVSEINVTVTQSNTTVQLQPVINIAGSTTTNNELTVSGVDINNDPITATGITDLKFEESYFEIIEDSPQATVLLKDFLIYETELPIGNILTTKIYVLPDGSWNWYNGTNWFTNKNGGLIEDAIVDGVIDKAPSQNAVFDALETKVDKIVGKGLSEEDFTTTEKSKLSGIEAGAEVNNISDINATDLTDSGDTSLHHHDSRYYTEAEVDNFLDEKFDNPTGDNTQYLDGAGTPTTFPTIPTKTSELTNDGDNGYSHFISIEDLPSNLILYPTTAVSDIGGYYKLVTDIHDTDFDDTAVDISTGSLTTSNQLISSLATTSNLINGNPGVFNITVIGNIRKVSGSGSAEFYFRVYKRNNAGTETLIATSDTTTVISTSSYAEFSATALWDDGIFVSTDRVVLKFYANRISGGSNPTYEFQFGGTKPVRTLVPVALSIIGYTKAETDNLLNTKRDLLTWEYLVMNGKTDGATTSITGGEVLTYLQGGNTFYRHITTSIDSNGYPTEDAFYSDFDGTNLTNIITIRE